MKTTPRGLSFFLLVVALVLGSSVRAAAPNQNRGFSSDKVYAVGEIDSVNVFNGNLIVNIPLGPEYTVGPGLTYRFNLVHNGTIWDYEELLPSQEGRIGEYPPGLRQAVPEKYSNAGIGWLVTLGQLLMPTEQHELAYLGPDGSQHEFIDHYDGAPALFTEDGSYLRLRKIDANGDTVLDGYEIDFPDGSVRTFAADGFLKEILDAFGNWVRIDVQPYVWTITDGHGSQASGRVHRIELTDLMPRAGAPDDYPDLARRVISKIELAAPSSTATPGKLTFTFAHEQTLVGRGGNADRYWGQPSKCLGVPLLKNVTFPDGTSYAPSYKTIPAGAETAQCATFLYDGNVAPADSGSMLSLQLPTGGRIEWTHDTVYLNESVCGKSAGGLMAPLNGAKVRQRFVGVRQRRIYDSPSDSSPAVWSYSSQLNDSNTSIYVSCGLDGAARGWVTAPAEELVTTITAPDGLTTKHYFSIYPQDAPSEGSVMSGLEYGLPLSRKVKIELPQATGRLPLYLSSETFDDGALVQQSYVRYDYETDTVRYRAQNSRVADDRTLYPGDTCAGATCYTDTRRLIYDHAGHYKQTETSSNFPGSTSLTTFVDYRTPLSNASKWILGLYGTSWEKQSSGELRVVKRFTQFNDATGAQESIRTYAATAGDPDAIAPGAGDLLTASCRNSSTVEGQRGFVTSQRFFGGSGAVPADPCTAPRNPGDYFIDHEYSFIGTALTGHKTKYQGSSFYSSDEDYDRHAGLLTASRDAAGAATTYEYDAQMRLKRVLSPGLAPVSYTYDRTSYPHSVRVTTEEGQSTPKYDFYYFDGLGRPISSKTHQPNGLWATTVTNYDDSGRVKSVSMPEERASGSFEGNFVPAYRTVSSYDALGRVTAVTQPDLTVQVTQYTGHGTRERILGVRENAASALQVRSTERNDGAGRLIEVDEYSGSTSAADPIGDLVTTRYTYDVGNRLESVTTGTQNRYFRYDPRGFLLWEQHPEKGVAGNGRVEYESYDSRGHASRKNDGGVVTTYEYDEAERLRFVKDADGRTIKVFDFGQANAGADLRNGKLIRATRYNRLNAAGTIRVTESYAYTGAGGRVSSRDTNVEREQSGGAWSPVQTFNQSYTYEPDYGRVATIGYPSCPNCPERTVAQTHTRGVLTGVGDFATLGYHPNGMVKEVRRLHPATSVDRYESDRGMARPESIQFDDGDNCRPVISWAADQSINSGATATFTVSVVPGASVTWYRGVSGDSSVQVSQNQEFVTPPLTDTTRYWARVTLPGGCSLDSPTVTAEVCRLPQIIYPASDAGGLAEPVPSDQSVQAEVTAVATGIFYSWTVETVALVNGVWTATGAATPVAGNGASIAWTPPPGTTGKWGLRVTVTGSCPGAAPATRLVKVVDLFTPSTTTCEAPTLLGSIPPERRVWWASHSIELDQAVEPPATPQDFIFEWRINGTLVVSGAGQNAIATALHDLQPKLVTLRVWRDCGAVKSAVIERSTYLWTDENCPTPPLSVDQPVVDVDAQRAFTVSSVWPSVDFQWYEGDAGNTLEPIDADAGTQGRRLTPTAMGTYWVRATSRCGTTADSATLLATRSSCTPVQFIRQPAADTSTAAGATVQLTFETDSNPAVTGQQWFAVGNGTPISTAATLAVQPRRTTTYYATATNGCHTGRSADAIVHVTSCADINVIEAPRPESMNEGDSVQLSVTATSAYGLLYQWYEGESGDVSRPLAGATSAAVSVSPAKTTKFWVRIATDVVDGCAIDTLAVPVTVCRTPRFTRAEIGELNSPIPGVMHWREADVEGDNLSYTWYAGVVGNETTVLSAGRSIMLRPLTTMQFWLRVTSDCAPPLGDRSLEQQYRISVCPEIVTEPYAVQPKVMPGTPATLIVEALRGDVIEWYEGQTLVGYGATFQTAPINGTTTFYARVTSGACSITTSPVTVSLCDQPTVAWNSASLRTTAGQLQVLSVQHTSSGSEVSFTFYRGTPGEVSQSTLLQSDMYPTLGVHPDTTTTYWVRAREQTGCYADTPSLTIDVCVPRIVTQPQSKTINAHTTTQLSVAIDLPASPRITYRWYAGSPGNTSQPVPGGTASTIDVTPAADTTYWVRITSECNTGSPVVVDSEGATVTVCAPPAITEQPIPAAGTAGIPASLRVVATGTELAYQWYRGVSGDVANPVNNATSANLSVTVSQTTDFWVKVAGRCGTVSSNTVRVSIAPVITLQPAGAAVTQGTARVLSVSATGSYLEYQWYSGAGTANPVTGATSASFTTPALNADASYWVRVRSGTATVDSELAVLTVCQPRNVVVTYSTKVSGSAVTLQVDASAADEAFEWYQGPRGSTTTFVGSGTYVNVYPLQTTDYWVRTKRATCDADSAAVTVRVCTPKINTQPQSGSTLTGTSATLSVSATGTSLTYQWYEGASGNTSLPVSGATSATFTTPPLTAAKTYWVRVSSPAQSGCGSSTVDSQAATISICNVPAISSTTGNQRTISGSAVTLSVTATGGNLQYEWHQGAVGSGPVIGTNSSISVSPSATTTYWVRVYNGCGTVNSNAIRVSIYPVITQQPVDTAACNNGIARVSLTATGNSLSYVWYRQYSGQGAQVVGGNNPYVDLTVTAPATVYCAVTSGDATTVSNTVNLSVLPAPASYTLTKTVYSPTQWKLTATVAPSDADLVQYEWYRGALGDTSNRITAASNAYLIVVTPPSLPMTYWVRVKYIDTGCSTDKAITIQ